MIQNEFERQNENRSRSGGVFGPTPVRLRSERERVPLKSRTVLELHFGGGLPVAK